MTTDYTLSRLALNNKFIQSLSSLALRSMAFSGLDLLSSDNLLDDARNIVIRRKCEASIEDIFSVYLPKSWHNNLIMTESTCYDQNIKEFAENQYYIFASLVSEDNIDFDEKQYYFDYLEDIRISVEYPEFVKYVEHTLDVKICKAICIFLSQKRFEFIRAYEEQLVVTILQRGTIGMQAFALETILTWGQVSNMQQLNSIQISNRYLQKDLNEFIRVKQGK